MNALDFKYTKKKMIMVTKNTIKKLYKKKVNAFFIWILNLQSFIKKLWQQTKQSGEKMMEHTKYMFHSCRQETVQHLFQECSYMMQLRFYILNILPHNPYAPYHKALSQEILCRKRWRLITTTKVIWRERCRRIFTQKIYIWLVSVFFWLIFSEIICKFPIFFILVAIFCNFLSLLMIY